MATDRTAASGFDSSEGLLHVSIHPHIRCAPGVPSIMLWVLAALIPAMTGAVLFFGLKALLLALSCTCAAVAAEWLFEALLKKPRTINDYSAVVTGVLLALTLPPSLPLWMAFLGGLFAVGAAKIPFGGLGYNFLNPALAGRAFLMISYPAEMSCRTDAPQGFLQGAMEHIDGLGSATPLAHFKAASAGQALDLQSLLSGLLWGNTTGCLGETSAALLLAGAAFLWYRRIIGFAIPVAFAGTAFILFWLFNGSGAWLSGPALLGPLCQVMAGGLLLGALFMAADPVTSPATPWGKVFFGAGCGALTFIIRKFGSAADGVCFAILVMNCLAPLLDICFKPRRHAQGAMTGIHRSGETPAASLGEQT